MQRPEPCVTGSVECRDKKGYPELGAGLGMELGTVTFTVTMTTTQQRLCCTFVHNTAPPRATPSPGTHRGICEAESSPPSQVVNHMLPLLALSLSRTGLS